MIDQNQINLVMSITLRCRDVDFSKVRRDQAAAYVRSQCRGLSQAQTDVVIRNVLGDK